MPTKRLPFNPDIEHLKHQAKDLLNDRRAAVPQAYQRIREFHPKFNSATGSVIDAATFTLSDAQLTIAREYGFPSWSRLRTVVDQSDRVNFDLPHHERIEDPVFRQALDLLDEGDADGLRTHLASHSDLVTQRLIFEGENYFRNPTLLEFVAENPVRHDHLPPNIVDITRVILDAGAKSDRDSIDSILGLVCTGRVPRECSVQVPLIHILCDYGANPDYAMPSALAHGEFEAVDALLERGATVDLTVAAATGKTDDVHRLLSSANATHKHRALALAAQFGHARIVRMLLLAGEDPNRFNPQGCHAHSTPLHQAALAGQADVVQVLVEAGARLDIKDIHHSATPQGWAEYAGQSEIAEYLKSAR